MADPTDTPPQDAPAPPDATSATVDPSFAMAQVKAANLLFQSSQWMNDMVIRSRSRGQARALLVNSIVSTAMKSDIETQLKVLRELDTEASEDTSLTEIAIEQAKKA